MIGPHTRRAIRIARSFLARPGRTVAVYRRRPQKKGDPDLFLVVFATCTIGLSVREGQWEATRMNWKGEGSCPLKGFRKVAAVGEIDGRRGLVTLAWSRLPVGLPTVKAAAST